MRMKIEMDKKTSKNAQSEAPIKYLEEMLACDSHLSLLLIRDSTQSLPDGAPSQ
jgi:hypothetical protein